MVQSKDELYSPPRIRIHVTEPGASIRRGCVRCEIDKNVEFSTTGWKLTASPSEPNCYDALLVAAAAEFGDRIQRRPSLSWRRDIELMIPVHGPERWREKAVSESLHDALNFLTGDRWQIDFCERVKPLEAPRQGQFNLPADLAAVIPFSDGLDSRCVAGIQAREIGDKLIRVRLGKKTCDGQGLSSQREVFHFVPYHVRPGKRQFVESTSRSRGFSSSRY